MHYSSIANEHWTRGVLTAENIESIEMLDLPFTHRSHIFIRLNFIKLSKFKM